MLCNIIRATFRVVLKFFLKEPFYNFLWFISNEVAQPTLLNFDYFRVNARTFY